MSRCDLEKAVHAFISSRLDYCNVLYFGIDQTLLHRLQLVQNAAVRLLTKTGRCDHVTPVLFSHWLPAELRTHFQLLLFVFSAIDGLAVPYLCEILSFHQPSRTQTSV